MHYPLSNPVCSLRVVDLVVCRLKNSMQLQSAKQRQNQKARKATFERLYHLHIRHISWKTAEESVGKEKGENV